MANLDMTLDDMIKMNKTPRTSGSGPYRSFRDRSARRAAPYSYNTSRAPETQLEHDMLAAEPAFPFRGGARASEDDTGTKLLISNLHYEVSDDDIQDIFSVVGDLKSFSVHYDRTGRSKGTAEVVFYRRQHAEAAMKRFNNVPLDGMPLRIEIVGMNLALPPVLPPPSQGRFSQDQGRGGAVRQPQGVARGMRKDCLGGRGRGENMTAEDLDADLEKYLAEAQEKN